MSNTLPEAEILTTTEKALNAFLHDDLQYIDGLQWEDDQHRAANSMARRLNGGLVDNGVKDFTVKVELKPARITIVTVQ